MKIIMTTHFKKSVKKLLRHQVSVVEEAIDEIASNPQIGKLKKGDLVGVRVHKFNLYSQTMLLAYQFLEKKLVLLSLNTHENFYRDLKRKLHECA